MATTISSVAGDQAGRIAAQAVNEAKKQTAKNEASTVTIDLRYNGAIRNRNYTLSDINYAPSDYLEDGAANVIPMLLLEKQPKYPIYADSVGDVLYQAYEWIASQVGNVKLGKALTGGFSYGAQYAGRTSANNIVSDISQSAKASQYWSNPNTYGAHTFGLFNIEGGSPIHTYEMPFYSDYFITTDGTSGWKTGGAELWYGRGLSELAARMASIGYPTTPDWDFNPHYERMEFSFHLINDTPEATLKNTIWVYSLVAGTMYVQIENQEIDLNKLNIDLSQQSKEGTTGLSEAVKKLTGVVTNALVDYIKTSTAFYKSPNVYEAIVPGRLRWLWCSMAVDVKCVGKFFKDSLEMANGATQSMADEGAAFPEAYKVTVNLNSLLPQSFNQFNYFLLTKHTSSSSAVDTHGVNTPPDLDKLIKTFCEAFSGLNKENAIQAGKDGASTIAEQLGKNADQNMAVQAFGEAFGRGGSQQ